MRPELREGLSGPEGPEAPAERIDRLGPEAASLRELVAVLVGGGGSRGSAMDISDRILEASEGDLRRLSSFTVAELRGLPGVGAAAARIVAALELGRRAALPPSPGGSGGSDLPECVDKIRGPADVYARMGPRLRHLRQEEFHVLLLNTRHRVLGEVVITRGTLDASLIHSREVFRPAIAASASAVILVHNHPSGDPAPSAEDRRVTRQLAEAGKTLGISVLDHVIVGDGSFLSLSEVGGV